MDAKKRPIYIYCLQEIHFRPGDTDGLKVMGWKKIFHAKGNQKKAGGVVITGKNEQHNCVFPDCN